jgi:hypothetical protein
MQSIFYNAWLLSLGWRVYQNIVLHKQSTGVAKQLKTTEMHF